MVLASTYVARSASAFAAYNGLQCALMHRHLARGGTIDDWCLRLAPVFRARYDWILTTAAPSPRGQPQLS